MNEGKKGHGISTNMNIIEDLTTGYSWGETIEYSNKSSSNSKNNKNSKEKWNQNRQQYLQTKSHFGVFFPNSTHNKGRGDKIQRVKMERIWKCDVWKNVFSLEAKWGKGDKPRKHWLVSCTFAKVVLLRLQNCVFFFPKTRSYFVRAGCSQHFQSLVWIPCFFFLRFTTNFMAFKNKSIRYQILFSVGLISVISLVIVVGVAIGVFGSIGSTTTNLVCKFEFSLLNFE